MLTWCFDSRVEFLICDHYSVSLLLNIHNKTQHRPGGCSPPAASCKCEGLANDWGDIMPATPTHCTPLSNYMLCPSSQGAMWTLLCLWPWWFWANWRFGSFPFMSSLSFLVLLLELLQSLDYTMVNTHACPDFVLILLFCYVSSLSCHTKNISATGSAMWDTNG